MIPCFSMTVMDAGYSWVVLAATFSASVLVYGFVWSLGVSYEIFLEFGVYHKAEVAFIFSINTGMLYSSGELLY